MIVACIVITILMCGFTMSVIMINNEEKKFRK